ncbi:MAG: flagellar biosynthesis protein FlhB [Deltaproteobacteria bacterium]|nr:flagellar biosynthesis protein FlhB [Deltaproteobacteria bacterium]
MASSQERSEKPTAKRLRKARERGQTAKSRELVSVGVLLFGAAAVYLSGRLIFEGFRDLFQAVLNQSARPESIPSQVESLFTTASVHLLLMIAPTLLAASIAAVGINIIQLKGFAFSFQAMRITLSNLNPLQGIKRFFSLRSFTELVKSIAKLIIIGYAVYSVVSGERETLLQMVDQDVPTIAYTTANLAFKLVVRVMAVMLMVSLLDFAYQKWQHNRDLMMTKQEIKEEYKETEGNPQIKSRIRTIQRTLARQRMLSEVKKATMVITNPTHYAVALSYSAEMEAPRVVAMGVDHLARKIIQIARREGVPIVQNPPLARALYRQVRLDETIPVELYRAVAKVLAYVLQQKRPSAK